MSNQWIKLILALFVSLGLVACTGNLKTKEPAASSTVEADSNMGEEESDEVRTAFRDAEDSEEEVVNSEEEGAKALRGKLRSWTADELMLTKAYFDYDSSALSKDTLETIGWHADFMKEYPEVILQLHGHTDERGSQDYNLSLGERRGHAVAQSLINKGISADRVTVISFGESRPVDEGHTEKAWAKNRRVEFLYE